MCCLPVTHHLLTADSLRAISAVLALVDSIIWASSRQILHHWIQVMGEGMAMYLLGFLCCHWSVLLVTKGYGKKESDYLKTSSKLGWGTHPPAQFLTIYFLTNFPPVEHPPFPWIFDKIKQFYAFKITYSNLQTNFLKSVVLVLLLKTLKMY